MNLEKVKKYFYSLCLIYTILSIIMTPKLAGKIIPADFLMLLIAGLFIWILFKEKRFYLAKEFLIIFFLIILFLLIDLGLTGNYLKGLLRILGQGYLFLVFLVFYYFSESGKYTQQVFKAWLGTGLVLAIIGLFAMLLYLLGYDLVNSPLLVGPGGQLPAQGNIVRIGGDQRFSMGPEFLALFFLSSILALLYFHRNRSWKFARGIWFFMFFLILICADFLTYTRSFFCWILVVLVWDLLVNEKKNWLRTTVDLLGICLLFAFLFIMTVWNIFPIHLKHLPEEKQLVLTISTEYSYPRVQIYYPEAIKSIKQNPIWGNGPGHNATGPVYILEVHFPEGADAHNIILQLWTTRGIFGLVLYLAFWAMTIIQPLRRFRSQPLPLEAKTLLAIALGMMLVSFTVDIEDFRHLYVVLGLLAGFSSPRFPSTN